MGAGMAVLVNMQSPVLVLKWVGTPEPPSNTPEQGSRHSNSLKTTEVFEQRCKILVQ